MDATKKRQFGPYLIVQNLGVGGVAKVYKAIDQRDGQVIALKILHITFAEDSDMGQRFKKESEIVKALNHPCIVPIYDYGLQRGRPYVVMKFMAKGSLAGRFDTPTEITSQEVVRLLRRIASALDHAHRRGVVHRDIKLENILLDERGEAALSDFGLARVTDGNRLTVSGDIIGTPAYMSPEQTRGKKSLDFRTDLYSLAIVTYLLTVGRLPFTGGLLSVLNQQVNSPPPLPSKLFDDLPPALDAVVLRGLAKNPQDRYQSADALIEAYAKVMTDHVSRRVLVDLQSSHQSTTEQDAVDVPAFWEPEKPTLTADDLVEAAKDAMNDEEALGYLRRALEINPWHDQANRMRLKLEGAHSPVTTTTKIPAVVAPTQPLPELKRNIWMTDAQRERVSRRKTRRRIGIISVVMLSMACTALTFSLVGIIPGVIGFTTQLLGGGRAVTQIDGVPIEDIPNAAALVPPSKSVGAPQQGADAIDHGYSHEYVFAAQSGQEYYIYIQFMSVSAGNVAKNVAVLDPSGGIVTDTACQSLGDSGLLGGEGNTTITCEINQNGFWKVRILGVRGESVGAYFIGVRSADDLN